MGTSTRYLWRNISELSLTTAVYKSLFENNVMLKTRHKALLADIPGMPGSSNIDFPLLPSKPSAQMQSSYFHSLPRSTWDSIGLNLQSPLFRVLAKLVSLPLTSRYFPTKMPKF